MKFICVNKETAYRLTSVLHELQDRIGYKTEKKALEKLIEACTYEIILKEISALLKNTNNKN